MLMALKLVSYIFSFRVNLNMPKAFHRVVTMSSWTIAVPFDVCWNSNSMRNKWLKPLRILQWILSLVLHKSCGVDSSLTAQPVFPVYDAGAMAAWPYMNLKEHVIKALAVLAYWYAIPVIWFVIFKKFFHRVSIL